MEHAYREASGAVRRGKFWLRRCSIQTKQSAAPTIPQAIIHGDTLYTSGQISVIRQPERKVGTNPSRSRLTSIRISSSSGSQVSSYENAAADSMGFPLQIRNDLRHLTRHMPNILVINLQQFLCCSQDTAKRNVLCEEVIAAI